MRCLFCKKDSSETKSIEHIVPESLGNKSFVLPLGYVCDKCNNYFALRVEKPFMELKEIQYLRFHEEVPNKKNRIPQIDGMLDNGSPIKLIKKRVNNEIMHILEIKPEHLEKTILNRPSRIIIPAFSNKDILESNKIVSRFIAKIALEALADRLKNIENSLNDLIDDKNYDQIRNHARYGNINNWPCNIRRIYNYDKNWGNNNELEHKIFECDFLLIPIEKNLDLKHLDKSIDAYLYFIIALWGMEFAINMAGPEIDGYLKWLKEHDDVSPLYFGKNEN